MTHFTNRDMIAVRCNLRGQNDAILCSLYLRHEPNKPEIELSTLIKFKELAKFSNERKLALIIGADSNGHHILWNSYKSTPRGRILADLINELSLTIHNKGKNPTFVNSRGHKSIIDITLSNNKGNLLLSN